MFLDVFVSKLKNNSADIESELVSKLETLVKRHSEGEVQRPFVIIYELVAAPIGSYSSIFVFTNFKQVQETFVVLDPTDEESCHRHRLEDEDILA